MDSSFSQESVLEEVFNFFGLDEYVLEGKAFLQNLLKEKMELNTQGGELLQICLPKYFSNYVFLCVGGGNPIKRYNCFSGFCKEKRCNCKACGRAKNKQLFDIFDIFENLRLNPKSLIESYCNFANRLAKFNEKYRCMDTLSFRLNEMQVRMYLNPEVFLDPNNDVQIYRYSLQSQHEVPVLRYQSELEAFANYILYRRQHPTNWALLFSHPIQYFQNWFGSLFNTPPQ